MHLQGRGERTNISSRVRVLLVTQATQSRETAPDYRVVGRQENLGGLHINYPNVLTRGSYSQLQKVRPKHLQATHRPRWQKKTGGWTGVYKISGLTVRQEFTYDVEDTLVSSWVIDTYNLYKWNIWLSTNCKNRIAILLCLRPGFHEMQWFVRFLLSDSFSLCWKLQMWQTSLSLDIMPDDNAFPNVLRGNSGLCLSLPQNPDYWSPN